MGCAELLASQGWRKTSSRAFFSVQHYRAAEIWICLKYWGCVGHIRGVEIRVGKGVLEYWAKEFRLEATGVGGMETDAQNPGHGSPQLLEMIL